VSLREFGESLTNADVVSDIKRHNHGLFAGNQSPRATINDTLHHVAGIEMKTRAVALGLAVLAGLGQAALAGNRGRCCDPVAVNIQARCCQGTLLPYHVAISRADDATRAEAALATTTSERNALVDEKAALQAQLAKLQAELKESFAQRDKAISERDTAVAERDKARTAEAAASKLTANCQQAQKTAEAAATKAQTEAKAALEVAKKATDELAATKSENERLVAELKSNKDELKKMGDEMEKLKIKLAAVIPEQKKVDNGEQKSDDDKKDDPKDAGNPETAEAKPEVQ
jgi:hypothetical protein